MSPKIPMTYIISKVIFFDPPAEVSSYTAGASDPLAASLEILRRQGPETL